MVSRVTRAQFARAGMPIPKRAPIKRTKGKAKASPEYALHIRAVVWLRRRNLVFLHPANGRGGASERMHGARLGVMNGAPDLIIFTPDKTLGIELKAETGSVSRTQVHAHEQLKRAGVAVAVCRSIEEIAQFLESEGALPA